MMIKVNKTKARKLYDAGVALFLIPCKVSLDNIWGIGGFFDKSCGKTFDALVNEFEYYNCNNNEMGKYCSFYFKQVPNLSKLQEVRYGSI